MRVRRPSHAAVVAYLALFIALGGGAYAAVRVGSKQIVDNSIRSKDIRDNQVRGIDLDSRQMVTRSYAAILRPSGPQSVVGVVRSAGGPRPELTYVETGHWNVKFKRTRGLGCAFPTVTSMASSDVVFKIPFVFCDDNETDFDVVTAGGEDDDFVLHVDFGGSP